MKPSAKRWLLLAVVLVLAVLAVHERGIARGMLGQEGATLSGVFRLRVGVWFAAIGVLAMYSFLIRENRFYRVFEHILLGTAVAFGATVLLRQVILAKWWHPMAGAFAALATRDPTRGNPGEVWLLVPGVIGLLWYFQFSKRYLWLNRIAVAVTVGAGAGLALKRSFFELLPQITKSFKPLFISASMAPGAAAQTRLVQSVENVVFLTATVSVLFYFFFVVKQRRAVVRGTAKLGRWFLMITLGAFFGNTFMTRLSALIERFHFLLSEWLMVVPR